MGAFTFFKLYKWYQIAQSITASGCHGKLNRHSSCIVLSSDLSLLGNPCTCFNPSILKWNEFVWICQVWNSLKFLSFVSLSWKIDFEISVLFLLLLLSLEWVSWKLMLLLWHSSVCEKIFLIWCYQKEDFEPLIFARFLSRWSFFNKLERKWFVCQVKAAFNRDLKIFFVTGFVCFRFDVNLGLTFVIFVWFSGRSGKILLKGFFRFFITFLITVSYNFGKG